MQSKYQKLVRQRFEQLFQKDYPQFKRLKGMTLPYGARVYEWKIAEDLIFYLELCFSKRSDAFYVLIIWTENGSFPIRRAPYGIDVHKNGTTCFSIERLWDPGQFYKEWHLVPDAENDLDIYFLDDYDSMAINGVEPAVDDAISRIKEHLIPYFRKVAHEHGYEI